MGDAGTLIVIGVSRDAIVIGADSALFNKGKGVVASTGRKIYPTGRFAACMFIGTTALQKRINGTVSDEARFTTIAEKWLGEHPEASVRDAYASIDAEILSSMRAFQQKHPEFAGSPDDFASFGCVGYDMGLPVILFSDYVPPAAAGGEIVKSSCAQSLRGNR